MKPLPILLLAVLATVMAQVSLAGPGIQYWRGQCLSAASPGNSGCERMWVPNTGPTANKFPVTSVTCTPEMRKNDFLCQKACNLTSDASAARTGASCTHMLVRNTGPSSSRIPFVSVACTPAMAANDPACQSHCRL